MLIKVCAAKNIRFGLNSQPEVVWTTQTLFSEAVKFRLWVVATCHPMMVLVIDWCFQQSLNEWELWHHRHSTLSLFPSCHCILHLDFALLCTRKQSLGFELPQEGTQWGFNCHGGDFGNAMHAELWAAQNIKFWMTSQAAMAFTAQPLLCKTAKFRLWIAIIWCLIVIFVNDWCF